jgi:hypothetical protein
MAEHDPHLDATLRHVPPPADAARLASADAVFSDDAIDRLLTDLAVPAGLVARLRAAIDQPATSRRGGAIDLERIAAPPRVAERRRSLLGRWGLALARDGFAVAAALSVAWALFTIGHEVSSRLAAPVDGGSARIAATRPAAVPDRSATPTAAAETPPPARRPGGSAAGSLEPVPTTEAIAVAARGASDDVAMAAAPSKAAPSVRGAAVGAAVPPPSAALGSVAEWLVDQPREVWRLVPRVRGFDLAFEMAHGEQPFADPSIRGLSRDAPPLSLRTTSFDRLAAGVAAWKAPVRGFRMEDLLAAIPSPSVPAAMSAGDAVVLRVIGVRSLRRVRGQPSLLVEIAATAGSGRSKGRAPLDATLVIDRSTGADPMIWPWLCASLTAIAGGMGPDDRLSIVVAGPMPRVAVSRGDSAAIAAAAADLVQLPPTDVADLDAAVRLATSPAEATTRPLVVLAQRDSAERAREEARMALGSWHESQASAENAAAADGARPRVGFVLVDATAGPGSAPAATTFGSTAADATAIRREAIRQVFAADHLVARQCRLAVSFKPETVASWRLVGHRQSVVESLATTRPAPLDLHAGETARAIYEVVPRGAAVPVVAAELDWRDAADGAPRRARATLETTAADLAAALPSPHGCELLLAVAVAEAAGGSVHADPAATAAAAELARRWRERGDVSPFGAVLATCLERQAGGRRMPR